ncbi:MAG TPA: EF-hand domain-containing protein [Xanthomonadaceae bacterium]|jgi:hypothetical protein
MKTILLVPLLLLALPAMAQTDTAPAPAGSDGGTSVPKRTPRERFEQADTDHDGRLSRNEAQAMPFVAKQFDAIDANHDGYVTLDEMRAAWAQKRAMRAQRSGGQGQPGNSAPQPAPAPQGGG